MFTGIIENIGKVKQIKRGANSVELTVASSVIPGDLKLGDSVAVNGVCLTVTSFDQSGFTVDAVPETMSRTNLGELQTGSPVNLERAMQAGSRLGGHMMNGHVDGIAQVDNIRQEDNAVWFTIKANKDLLKYMIPKGSIAVDGISLTIVDVGEEAFTISVIPHTLQWTTLKDKQKGDSVNIECDMIGKYVERFLGMAQEKNEPEGKITMDFLKQNGYI
ncbi:MAG: riboflavin synthase [Bacteroidales bacterium]|nr:riboflavin synthase [Bacteroidales bacterium]